MCDGFDFFNAFQLNSISVFYSVQFNQFFYGAVNYRHCLIVAFMESKVFLSTDLST